MKTLLHDQSFKKLNLNYLNSDNITLSFRQLLIKYKVHFEKIRHYNWSYTGSECNDLNKEFQSMCQTINHKINQIDCMVYDFNGRPQMKIEDALKSIDMNGKMGLLDLINQVNDILSDFSQLHDTMLKCVSTSFNNSVSATKHLVTQFIQRLEERN